MGTFLDQLPALLGVGVGTVGTILSTQLNDRAHWKRTRAVRWDERRLDAYAQFARALKEVHHVAMRLTAPQLQLTAEQRNADLLLLGQAEVERTKNWEGMLLLGDTATVQAGREWRWTVGELVLAARGRSTSDFDRETSVRAANLGRDRFYEAARAGLNVTGGTVAQAAWLDESRPR
jgi:hypothetical protein